MRSHLRLVVSDRHAKQAWIGGNPTSLAFQKKREAVAMRNVIVNPPVRNRRFLKPATKAADSICAAESVNKFVCCLDHGERECTKNSYMSTRHSYGLTGRGLQRTIRPMLDQVNDVEAICRRVIFLREKSGMSQAAAARACGIGRTTWNTYERLNGRPRLDHAAMICDVFGVTLDWLYTGNKSGLSQVTIQRLFGTAA